jgi:hypothetical protein
VATWKQLARCQRHHFGAAISGEAASLALLGLKIASVDAIKLKVLFTGETGLLVHLGGEIEQLVHLTGQDWAISAFD